MIYLLNIKSLSNIDEMTRPVQYTEIELKERHIASVEKYRKANLKKVSEMSKTYYNKNKERICARRRFLHNEKKMAKALVV